MTPQLTERQKSEKAKNLALQEKYNAEGQRKFERDNQSVLDEGKEKMARGLMQGGLTWKQMLDLPKKQFGGSGNNWCGVSKAYQRRMMKNAERRRKMRK